MRTIAVAQTSQPAQNAGDVSEHDSPGVAPTTVAQYLAAQPADRRAALAAVRAAINARLPRGYEETLQSGMISWVVPASHLSHTYNGQPLPLASLGAQKSHLALYLVCVYSDPALSAWFSDAWSRTGKPLDMGKSCVRFAAPSDLALDVISEAIARAPIDAYVAQYERNRSKTVKQKPVAPGAEPKSARSTSAKSKPVKSKSARSSSAKAEPSKISSKAKPSKPSSKAQRPRGK